MLLGQTHLLSPWKVWEGVAVAEQGREVMALVDSLIGSVKGALPNWLSLGLELKNTGAVKCSTEMQLRKHCSSG